MTETILLLFGGSRATHTDPGADDWDYYMEPIGGSTGGGGGGGGGGTSTGNVIGVVADSDIYNGDRIVGATVWVEETGESLNPTRQVTIVLRSTIGYVHDYACGWV